MAYDSHFRHADDVVDHLNTLVPGITDTLLQAKYVGFVAVAAVTVYELAIRDIFIAFAREKHDLFGHFVASQFERINGRIRLDEIKRRYISRFGSAYKKEFQKRLDARNKEYFQEEHRDIQDSYANIITWRNEFAHRGEIKATATYEEAVQAYEDGKEVIRCLASCMMDESISSDKVD